MKVTGTATLHAPVGAVWDALNDPAVLVRTIPGCERLETTGPDAYLFTVTAGVASVRGTYSGDISLTDKAEPESFTMRASGSGGPGTVSTTVAVRLADAGNDTTSLRYDADATVGGVIAGVGQRMLTSVAKRMAGDFFSAVDDVLTGAAGPGMPVGAYANAPTGIPGPAVDGDAARVGATVTERGGVFVAPGRGGRGGFRGFPAGAFTGAVIALAGVAVGGWLGHSGLTVLGVALAAVGGGFVGALAGSFAIGTRRHRSGG